VNSWLLRAFPWSARKYTIVHLPNENAAIYRPVGKLFRPAVIFGFTLRGRVFSPYLLYIVHKTQVPIALNDGSRLTTKRTTEKENGGAPGFFFVFDGYIRHRVKLVEGWDNSDDSWVPHKMAPEEEIKKKKEKSITTNKQTTLGAFHLATATEGVPLNFSKPKSLRYHKRQVMTTAIKTRPTRFRFQLSTDSILASQWQGLLQTLH